MIRAFLLICLAVLVLAAPASAAVVRVDVDYEFDPDDDFGRDDTETTTVTVEFGAASGERNRVSIRMRDDERLLVRDIGAPLRAGRRCRQRGEHVALCNLPYGDITSIDAELGDRADRFFAENATFGVDVVGGAGRDRIRGSRTNDSLDGGGGIDNVRGGGARDQLYGGPGKDHLRGGDGNDVLHAAGRDTFVGGEGSDMVSYAGSIKPVKARIQRPRFRQVEGLIGGRAGDTLIGNGADNRIVGGPGPDLINARAGDDRISPAGFDEIACGDGDDDISFFTNDKHLMREDCERGYPYEAGGSIPLQPRAVTADAITIRLPCASDTPGGDRRVTLTTPAQRPYFIVGPFEALVAEGQATVGGLYTRCDTALPITELGRSLQRPLPVIVKWGDLSWTFRLVSPSS